MCGIDMAFLKKCLFYDSFFKTTTFFLCLKKKKMSIKEAQTTVDHWINTIGVRYFNELTNTALLTEEVGEVARLMARIYGEQSFKNTESAATAKEDLADEMADVLFVLICLANQTGIDLEEAMAKNLEKKTKRDKNRHIENEKLIS
jgi:NTP pyrophosphatase (non-canonical NTP hydrolase)